MMISQKDLKRFKAKIEVKEPDDCWPWLTAKTKLGYGVFSLKRKYINAHRISFYIANGYLPCHGRVVMHDCENPSCQNPKHLIDGTVKQNGNYPGCIAKLKAKIGCWKGCYGKAHKSRWGKKHSIQTKQILSEKAQARGGWHKGLKRTDKTRKKISQVTRGENNAGSILTDKIVKTILNSTERNIDLARRYKVDASIISGIKRRVRWTHVKP